MIKGLFELFREIVTSSMNSFLLIGVLVDHFAGQMG